jgi:bacterioferritin (cytochrome b1)
LNLLQFWKRQEPVITTAGQISVHKTHTPDQKKLLETLVEDEERHFDQYDVEINDLKKNGENYLSLQSIERSKQNFRKEKR